MACSGARRQGWCRWWGACALLCTVLLVGCSGGLTTSQGNASLQATCAGQGCAPGTGAQGVQVFVEPEAKEAPILHAIGGATRSVWVEVYLLSDGNVIHALEDAASRGIDVRVLLEAHPYGEGSTTPQRTLEELQAAGVKAEAADPAYHYTHEKALLVDSATAYILTANLTRSGLGGSSYTTNREYGVIDTNIADVREVSAIFQADWSRATPMLGDPNLVVSPVDARAKITAVLHSAHASLHIEDEEMYDTQSEDVLIAAARRGVNVEVLLPAPSGSSSSGDADVARLTQGGVHVRYSEGLYMHAKLIVVDGKRVFVGSENFSSTSLDENRELGILIADSQALHTLNGTFASDWAQAQSA